MTTLIKVIGLVLVTLLCGCETVLYSSVTEREANEMVSALVRNGIPARKEVVKSGANVLIDEGDFGRSVDLLKQAGLPREQFSGMGEIFKKEGLISSPTEERARFIYALSQELSATISEVDGVLSARVHVVVPESGSSLDPVKPSSAAVFIRHRAGAPLERLTSQIKLLVTNSIEGLSYDKVSITMIAAEPAFDETSNGNMELIKVVGAWVHPSSAKTLWATVWLLSIIAVAAVLFALWMYRALARSEDALTRIKKAQVSSGNLHPKQA